MSDKSAPRRDQNPQEDSQGKSGAETAEDRPVLALLDGILALLEDMGRLAERAAQDSCGRLERVFLQRKLDRLRRELDRRVDSFESVYGDLPLAIKRSDDKKAPPFPPG